MTRQVGPKSRPLSDAPGAEGWFEIALKLLEKVCSLGRTKCMRTKTFRATFRPESDRKRPLRSMEGL